MGGGIEGTPWLLYHKILVLLQRAVRGMSVAVVRVPSIRPTIFVRLVNPFGRKRPSAKQAYETNVRDDGHRAGFDGLPCSPPLLSEDDTRVWIEGWHAGLSGAVVW